MRIRSHCGVVHRVLIHVVHDEGRRELRFDVFPGTTFSVSTSSDLQVAVGRIESVMSSRIVSERVTYKEQLTLSCSEPSGNSEKERSVAARS